MSRTKLLSPWRRFFQWGTTLVIVMLPWLRVDNQSLLRIDIPELSLYFFGLVLRIEELYLMLFACLALVLGFLLTTLVFGRVWCGWACPQTTLNDIAEWLAEKLKLKISNGRLAGTLWRKGLIQLCYALLAFLVAANLLWYFIEPRIFFIKLVQGELHYAAWVALLVIFATVFIDLAFIRRLMCSDFCPYGRIQTALVDPGTLTLHIPESEIARCIKCKSCVRVCPMGIDIRQGYQVECINCGRCLDACRKVMAPRKEEGLICYSFGLDNKGVKALFNPRTVLVTVATIVIISIFTVATFNRPLATLKISRSHLVADRILENGQQAVFFNAWVNNRTQHETIYNLKAVNPKNNRDIQIKGQSQMIRVAGGGNQKIDFVVTASPPEENTDIKFILKESMGEVVATAIASISPITHQPR